jgi:hypothetical protein
MISLRGRSVAARYSGVSSGGGAEEALGLEREARPAVRSMIGSARRRHQIAIDESVSVFLECVALGEEVLTKN